MALCFKNMLEMTTHQPKPAKFEDHTFRREFNVYHPEETVWKWLNDPKTFTDNQVWPYRVEFIKESHHSHDFQEGVFNAHHGPWMSFSGILGEIKPGYRDLKYLYGSYFLSMRWIRPHRLQFWTEPMEKGTKLTLQLDSYVSPSWVGFWSWGQDIFWGRFGRWMERSLAKINKP